jgi:hypothetical protein
MSGGRQDQVIQVFSGLISALKTTVDHADHVKIISDAHRYMEAVVVILARLHNPPANANEQYWAKLSDADISRISTHLDASQTAVLGQDWYNVLENSRFALNALPGDPKSWPKTDDYPEPT